MVFYMHYKICMYKLFKSQLLLLAAAGFFFSCEQVSNNELLTAADPAIINGTWRVERFTEGAVDETPSFNNIRFQLNDGGIFNVTRNGTVIASGNWQLLNGNRILDIRVPAFMNEQQATLQFGEDVYEIHDDWGITSFSSNRIELKSDDERFTLVKE